MDILATLRAAIAVYAVAAGVVVEWVWAPRGLVQIPCAAAMVIGLPVLVLSCVLVVFALVMKVCSEITGPETDAPTESFYEIRDKELAQRYQGRKMPIDVAYEAYMAEKLEFKGDLYTVLKNHRQDLFRFVITWVCLGQHGLARVSCLTMVPRRT